MSKLINIKSLLELFKKYDVDESGHIDFDEFLLLMQDMNLDITEGQARSLFILVDVDNSKEIDTQEFFSWWTKLSANSSVDDVTGAVTIIDYIYRLFRQSGNVYDGAIPAEQFQSVWNTIKKKFERTAHVDMASAEDLVTRFRIGGEKMVHLSDIFDWLPFYHLRKYAYLLTPNNSPRRPPKKATGEVLPQLPPDNLTASNIPLPPPPPLPPTNYKIQRATQELDIEVKARSTPPPKRTQNSNQNADFADEIKRAIQARLRITHEGDDTPSIGVTTPTPESSRKSSNATPPRIESPKSRDKPFIPKLPLHVDKRTPPKNWLLNPSPRPQLSDASCQTDPVEKEVEIRKVYIREPAIQVVSSPSKSEQQFEYVKKQNEELKKQVQKLEDLIDQSGSIPNITKQYQQMEIRCKEAADEIHKLKNLLLVYQSRSPRAVSPHTPRSVIESPTTRLLLSPRTPNSGSPNSRSPITRVSNEQIQYPSSSPRKLFGACYKYADTTFAVLTAGYARVNLKPAVVAVTSRQQSKKELGGIKQFIIDKGEWAIPSNQKKAPALKKVATTCFQNKHQSFILIEDTYCNVWEYLISSEEWKKLPPLPPKSKIFCSIYRVSANSLVVIGEILSRYMWYVYIHS